MFLLYFLFPFFIYLILNEKIVLVDVLHCCLIAIFLRILINLSFFLSLQALGEVKGGGRAEKVCSPPGVRGTLGAGVGHDGYPCEPASEPCVCWGPQSSWVSSSPLWSPSLGMEGQWASSSLEQAPKRAHDIPTIEGGGPKGRGGDIIGGASSLRPLWGHCWLLRNLYTPHGTAEGTSGTLLHPLPSTFCWILQVSQLEGLWQNVHMWAV